MFLYKKDIQVCFELVIKFVACFRESATYYGYGHGQSRVSRSDKFKNFRVCLDTFHLQYKNIQGVKLSKPLKICYLSLFFNTIIWYIIKNNCSILIFYNKHHRFFMHSLVLLYICHFQSRMVHNFKQHTCYFSSFLTFWAGKVLSLHISCL